ncbi:MAG TPA: hypothetical protein VHE32_01765 [Rhodanobacteraceae bacterium]|nr:hypothetical protein [Rhodanobacteraceae bacterium]
MSVRVCLADAAPRVQFAIDPGAARYVDALQRDAGPAPTQERSTWMAKDWRSGECLSYRAALGRIADDGARRGGGMRRADALLSDPGAWLLRVDGAGGAAEADVELPDGYAISAPWHPLPSTGAVRRFSIAPTPPDWIARVAIGRFDEQRIALAGGVLRTAILGVEGAERRHELAAWIERVGRATLSAYGRLPLADVQVLLVPARGTGREPIVFGESTRGQGHGVTLFVDPSQPVSALDRDWVAVHELSHQFHPYLDDRGSWLAEGLATYYQNVLRARAGLVTPAQAWQQIDAGLARGRNATSAHDVPLEDIGEGASGHANFMRTYWSGTAYWLDVDLALRRSSGNKLSVDEALRRFDACCLPDDRGWSPADFAAKLDTLVGSDVFGRRFAAYRTRRDFPDLVAVYRDLGIVRDGDRLRFDEHASAAGVRRAIMTARRPD